MLRWKHGPNWSPPEDAGYYTRWDQCAKRGCRTDQVMLREFHVPAPRNHVVRQVIESARRSEEAEQAVLLRREAAE